MTTQDATPQPRAASSRLRRRLPWLLPAGVAGAVVVAVAVGARSPSDASPPLPARTAAQLLSAVQTSTTRAFSGEVRQSANLGLPQVPGGPSDATLNWQSYLSGSHSARVWANGAQQQRVAVIGQLSEADIVHNGRDLWTYTSDTNAVSHIVLPTPEHALPTQPPVSPTVVAQDILTAIGPTTSVSVARTQTVAGRAAYTLELAPRDARSTVRTIDIAIDASTFVPLQVQVFATQSSTAALSIGFTSIRYSAPPASTFTFTPPKGATVSTDPFATNGGSSGSGGEHSAPKVIGSGWTSVVELAGVGPLTAHGPAGGLLAQLSSPVGTTGERLVHTALLNAVLMPDGRVFAGLVQPSVLEQIAGSAH